MLIFTAPAIIIIIMMIMKKIVLQWPNPFNAWMCLFVHIALSYIVLSFLFSLGQNPF